ncbi:hypothetical protein AMAG_16438 [Allomyces macrogynus ATCC 38327]|uniref:Uncharacterized protein n=1 Tax=Allomyces macrogynus (strain ATCC 38327) TaxID=578462 RepID=A0A0L0TDM0_ALLM3|nr:hypothetical protein AMAG_16438 [Allomyces macrogynus ATCC 38327]|eukprot:KNE72679.1 hypothetical protein AMAG_16438 [Allomyces macrogynus ATCC 38327]
MHVTSLWASNGTLSRGTFRPATAVAPSTDGKPTAGKRSKSAGRNFTDHAVIPVMVKTIHFDDAANDDDLILPDLATLATTEYAYTTTGDLGHRR